MIQLNAGKVKRGVNRTAKQKETSTCPDKRTKVKMHSLPEELMINILVLLPADVLYNTVRYVSFHWYKIIHDPFFIKAHLLRANAGLFIKYIFPSYNTYYVDMSTKDVTVTEINSHEFSGKVWESCDGLLLFSDPEDEGKLRVINPITKQWVALPPFPSNWELFSSSFTLARAHSTGEYKVAATYHCSTYEVFQCAIVTVGKKDVTWRTINTEHVSTSNKRILGFCPQSAGGYAYWITEIHPRFLILDVEAEVVHEFPAPKLFKKGLSITYLEIGDTLGCMFWCCPELVCEVLVLTDPKRGKWENLYKFDLHAERHMISSALYKVASPRKYLTLSPIAWLNNGEVVVFANFSKNITYFIARNVKTGDTYSFCMGEGKGVPYFLVHVNSLVLLEP